MPCVDAVAARKRFHVRLRPELDILARALGNIVGRETEPRQAVMRLRDVAHLEREAGETLALPLERRAHAVRDWTITRRRHQFERRVAKREDCRGRAVLLRAP